MSDEILLEEMERLKKKNKALVAAKKDNSIIHLGLTAAIVLTASLKMWPGVVASAIMWGLLCWVNRPKKVPAKGTGVYFIREDFFNYKVFEEMEDGSQRKITTCGLYCDAQDQMNWLKQQKRNK